MKPAILLVAAALAGAQEVNRPQDLVRATGALQTNEVAVVLEAVRQAVAGQAARLSSAPDGPGPEILFGTDGRRQLVRTVSGTEGGMVGGDGARTTWHTTVDTITDYTGKPARRCDGTRLDGNLVLDYRNQDGGGWTAAARTATSHEVLTPIFDMLDGITAMEAGDLRTLGARTARPFAAPWSPPGSIALDTAAGDPLSNAPRPVQTLWINVDSLRPVRWEVSLPGAPSDALIFTFDGVPPPRIPDGITAPDCVP